MMTRRKNKINNFKKINGIKINQVYLKQMMNCFRSLCYQDQEDKLVLILGSFSMNKNRKDKNKKINQKH